MSHDVAVLDAKLDRALKDIDRLQGQVDDLRQQASILRGAVWAIGGADHFSWQFWVGS
jgi:hypothetical protein